uniref:Uncharacterized protein n=1 Tax=Rhizophora mucronata TaxID=61149 RepID=A0A2P2NVQ7_RHIMU
MKRVGVLFVGDSFRRCDLCPPYINNETMK